MAFFNFVRCLQTNYLQQKTLGRIQTWVVGVEGEPTDNLTTIMASDYKTFSCKILLIDLFYVGLTKEV